MLPTRLDGTRNAYEAFTHALFCSTERSDPLRTRSLQAFRDLRTFTGTISQYELEQAGQA
jgi:hypothetical protein